MKNDIIEKEVMSCIVKDIAEKISFAMESLLSMLSFVLIRWLMILKCYSYSSEIYQ